MSFLLDTNVVSEFEKEEPDSRVFQWVDGVDEGEAWMSVVTIAELRSGCERLPDGLRKQRLEQWIVSGILPRFAGRILPIDEVIADTTGRLMARSRMSGRTIGAMDLMIAAIAHVHELTVVTRNTRDFDGPGVKVFNPWLEGE